VHRLDLAAGDRAETPAAYVRALDLSVERLEQTYTRLPDEAGHPRYLYAAPAFDFTGTLSYDESGLVLDYPGIAVRARLPVFRLIPGGLALIQRQRNVCQRASPGRMFISDYTERGPLHV